MINKARPQLIKSEGLFLYLYRTKKHEICYRPAVPHVIVGLGGTVENDKNFRMDKLSTAMARERSQEVGGGWQISDARNCNHFLSLVINSWVPLFFVYLHYFPFYLKLYLCDMISWIYITGPKEDDEKVVENTIQKMEKRGFCARYPHHRWVFIFSCDTINVNPIVARVRSFQSHDAKKSISCKVLGPHC